MHNLSNLPRDPGVYLFKDAHGEVLYVGKAKRLKDRVRSYFSGKDTSPKTRVLVSKAVAVEHIVVHNEVEALLLENKLIKQHSPHYNINLKDAKTYAYIKITDEPYPRIHSTRRVTKRGEYFGPYTDGFARQQLVKLCVELFELRTCKTLPKRACLNYHIGLCTAPCIQNVTRAQYTKQVEDARRFLKGEVRPVIQRLTKEMLQASKEEKFEKALQRKRQIEAIEHLSQRQSVDILKDYDQDVIACERAGDIALFALFSIKRGVLSGKREFSVESSEDVFEEFVTAYYGTHDPPKQVIVSEEFWEDVQSKLALEEYLSHMRGSRVTLVHPQRGNNKRLIELAKKNAVVEDESLIELKEALNLPSIPTVIECFDISNLGEDDVVAGMTRFVNGRRDLAGSRRFKIKSFEGQNDVRAMYEVVERRYKRLLEENTAMPNLILIDGGRGQLGAALEALEALGLTIPIIALAKKEEEIYLPHEDNPRRYDKHRGMLLLLRRIRDSVHTYAVSYQRKRREMRFREEVKK